MFKTILLSRLWHDKYLYAIIVAYAIFASSMAREFGLDGYSSYISYLIDVGFPALILFPAIALLMDYCAVIDRVDRRRWVALRRLMTARRAANLVAAILLFEALLLFMGAFTTLKNVLPLWRGGFPFDVDEAAFDSWLHMGTDPWRIISAAINSDTALALLNWNYGCPFFFVWFCAVFHILRQPSLGHMRVRFIVCNMLVLVVVGNLFAGLFLSAGPAYYGVITGDHARFADLLKFLAIDLDSADVSRTYHSYLWALYNSGKSDLGSGISAFPSVHVALATTMAIFAWEYRRWLGIAATAYATVILLSAVLLGWHYAIDGYASIILAVCIYALVRWANGSWRQWHIVPVERPLVADPAQ